ncbi:MAG: nucleoside-diphosphate-sugar epimerase [Paraglaciecola sp.]|jgi:nucleoside-diphosphate-sugar epimerase
MRVIVTGASGFVANALVDKLIHRSDLEVVPVSRSGCAESHVRVNNYTEVPTGDILVHLAENSNRLSVNKVSGNYLKESEAALDAMIVKGFSKIIYCSSAVVYGDSGIESYKEESPVYNDDNYTKLKLINEQKVLNAGGIVIRLANIIGVDMAKNNVLSDIISQLNGNGVVTVRNDQPIRDFVWIDDVVDALEILINEGRAGIYNIGTGIGVSVKNMAEIALRIAGESTGTVNSLATSTARSYNVVNIDKMKSMYRWSPKLSLEQSIKLMVEKV